ncbi:hypothetical protein [Helicobacter sp.]|uniref:hypothetical protein n=1 Tax=Helicobacter sp. TaxID=218 RepID=UPI002A919FCA|nr:hypothetical protein [Helicobacter sp.]MDY5556969.1 hypothetical protein [Helicobacter sp.]
MRCFVFLHGFALVAGGLLTQHTPRKFLKFSHNDELFSFASFVRFIEISEIPYYGLPQMLRILATTKSRLPRHCERSVAIHNLA